MSLPSYVINFDELAALLGDLFANGMSVNIGDITFSTAEIERLLTDIESKIQGIDYNDLITALNALGVKLDNLGGNLGMSGTQKIYGQMMEILSSDTEDGIDDDIQTMSFIVPASGNITGITYSLSAWRAEDNWDLVVGDVTLFKGVRTKEYGENKFFNVFYPITAGQVIKFVFNNVSSSSKTLWVDFNILESS